jgi:dihydrofolate synthase / folylpolyglutamate synthase
MYLEKNLSVWLEYLESFKREKPRVDLDALVSIAKKCDLYVNRQEKKTRVITIAGTNGKGSCTEMLTSVYVDAGYTVGTYTSPHLFSFHERIRIQKMPVDDKTICEAFAKIEKARADYVLTYFEFITLAALWIFKQVNVEIILLEVGIGGRLDATNIIDADLALISSIGLDHAVFLGNTRESVAQEKAGILRANQLAVCGDFNPPNTLKKVGKILGTHIFYIGKDFNFCLNQNNRWDFKKHTDMLELKGIPLPRLFINNAASVLESVLLLDSVLPVYDIHRVIESIVTTTLPGRCELKKCSNGCTMIVDVAHNEQAVSRLADFIQEYKQRFHPRKTRAIFSMFSDKAITQSLNIIKSQIDEWHVSEINNARSATKQQLDEAFSTNNIFPVWHKNLKNAYNFVEKQSETHDLMVVFGSFSVVAEVALF